ncbi:MAG TPA: ABC transporter substrate-binding protein, partial [Kofleriaceae bacterium]|nr:ABC transporter substrate-binding protein [Kofleriaceae bacterium]
HRDRIEIVSLRPTRLEHVLDDLERVGAALGRAAQAQQVRAALEQRLRDLAARATRAPTRPRVVSLEWIDPLMLGGTWMPELIELAGGLAVGALAGEPAPTISSEMLRDLRPDVVVIKPCGFTLERTLTEREVITRSVLSTVDASTRVYVTDGNAFFNRPGPRLLESLEIMAACIHPELFPDFARSHATVIAHL